MFAPHLDQVPKGLPVKTKIKADTKLTVRMCCQIVDTRTTAPSSGRFRVRPQPQTAAGVVYFLQIRPVYIFRRRRKNIWYFFSI